MVPGCPRQSVERSSTDRRRVVGRTRAQAHAQLLDLQLAHAGHDLDRLAQQLVDPAGVRLHVIAALLDGRAEHVAPIGARHEIAAGEAHDAAQQPGSCGIAQAQQLAPDGSHGQRFGDPLDLPAPRACGEHDLLGGQELVGAVIGVVRRPALEPIAGITRRAGLA
jgi:hypothetical protein